MYENNVCTVCVFIKIDTLLTFNNLNGMLYIIFFYFPIVLNISSENIFIAEPNMIYSYIF